MSLSGPGAFADPDLDAIRANDPLRIEMPSLDDIGEDAFGYAMDDEADTELTVRITGIASDRGKLLVFAYDDEYAFSTGDYMAAAGYAQSPATSGAVVLSIAVAGTPPYAVFALHDANSDNELKEALNKS